MAETEGEGGTHTSEYSRQEPKVGSQTMSHVFACLLLLMC